MMDIHEVKEGLNQDARLIKCGPDSRIVASWLEKQIPDENEASKDYAAMAGTLYDLGAPNVSDVLAEMSADEQHHSNRLEAMVDMMDRACEGQGGGRPVIPQHCKTQGIFLIEASEGLQYALGLMKPGEPAYSAIESLQRSEIWLTQAKGSGDPDLDIEVTQVADLIKQAKVAGREDDLSTMSSAAGRASELLRNMIPQTIADCACKKPQD